VKVPRDYWNDLSNQRTFLDELAKKLNITAFEEWYRVSSKDVIENGGRGLFKHYGFSIPKMLTTVYKEYPYLED
jgi:hypothetical protein